MWLCISEICADGDERGHSRCGFVSVRYVLMVMSEVILCVACISKICAGGDERGHSRYGFVSVRYVLMVMSEVILGVTLYQSDMC